jgi:cytoskeletal protein CcmA (bactofilin family)
MADKETVIGVETRIAGEIRGEEDLVIRGRVEGKIQLTQALTVEKGAIVQADVDVRALVVSGTLVGNSVASESIRLLSTARVVGDLAAPRVMMEAGAAYRGRVDMGDIEAARAAVAARPVSRPTEGAADAGKARPALARPVAPPKMASPAAAKVAPRTALAAPASPPPAAPPSFPRVAGGAANVAPPWAKKKLRRR